MVQNNNYQEEEALSPFTRTIDFYGEEGFQKLQDARVAVLGLGGVGSHVAVALARTGIGYLRIVDIDQVTSSGLNRHAVAVRSDIGRMKAELMEEHLKRINPEIQIDSREMFFHSDTADELLQGDLNYVVDAIDSELPKIILLKECVIREIPVISCMGAALRSDPTLLRVADISKTNICPLARNVRKKLRRQGVHKGIKTVFSIEQSIETLPPDEDEDQIQRGRLRRRLPSLINVPAASGMIAAGIVVEDIIKQENK